MHGKSYQVMDFAEKCMDDARTPPDAEVTHSLARRDAGTTLSTCFHDARCGGAPSRVWNLTHDVGPDTRRGASDLRRARHQEGKASTLSYSSVGTVVHQVVLW